MGISFWSLGTLSTGKQNQFQLLNFKNQVGGDSFNETFIWKRSLWWTHCVFSWFAFATIRSQFVKEAIDQTSWTKRYCKYWNWSWIDDCSQDGSICYSSAFSFNESKIVFISLKQNVGNLRGLQQRACFSQGRICYRLCRRWYHASQSNWKQVTKFLSLGQIVGRGFLRHADYVEGGLERSIRNSYQSFGWRKVWLWQSLKSSFSGCAERYIAYAGPTTWWPGEKCWSQWKATMKIGSTRTLIFGVRSSRNFKYAYLDEVLTKVRREKESMSSGWYHKEMNSFILPF